MTVAKPDRAESERIIRLAVSIAFRVLLVVLAVGLVAWWLFLVRGVLVIAFLALIVAAAIHAPVVALERRGLRRALAILVVYVLLVGAVFLLLALVVPPLVDQGRALAADLPRLVGSLSDTVNGILAQLGLSAGAGGLDTILGQLGTVGGVLARIPGVVVGFLSALASVTFLSALMILERDRARTWAMRFVASGDRPALDKLLRKAADRLGSYVRGQLLIMTVTGVGSCVGLTLIHVPFRLPPGTFRFLPSA